MRKVSAFTLLLATVLLAGCLKIDTTQVSVENPDDATGESQTIEVVTRPKDGLVDPVHGKEVGFWYGGVAGVNETKANGIAYLYKFEDKAFILVVNLNIELLKNGQGYYVAWLKKGTEVVKAGIFNSATADVRHSLKFETMANLDGFTQVIVTKEATTNPLSPSATVAEAMLKAAEH